LFLYNHKLNNFNLIIIKIIIKIIQIKEIQIKKLFRKIIIKIIIKTLFTWMRNNSTHAQHFKSHKLRCSILIVRNLTTKRQRFCIAWNFVIWSCFRLFAVICLTFLILFISDKSRDFFFSFFMSSNRLRVCNMKSLKSSFVFFHKEFWSFSTIVISWMSNCASRIVWCISCAILKN
jgi:hypothetical protein